MERRRAWDDRMLLVYLFPIAAVTVWHKCGSFKQHQFIILQSWRLESKTDLTGLILRCQQGCIPSGGSRGGSICFLAFPAATGCPLGLLACGTLLSSKPAMASHHSNSDIPVSPSIFLLFSFFAALSGF